jgi:hypothetical protein
MHYSVIINRDKLMSLKDQLGYDTNPPFYAFMRDRIQRHLSGFTTVRSAEFSGKRVGSGCRILLDLENDSQLDAVVEAAKGCGE